MAQPARPARRGDPQSERRDTGPLTDRGQARKDELLAAARRVFEREGYLDTRVADITAEAGAALGTFYTYFDSKETIFYEVAQGTMGQVLSDLHVDEVPKEPRDRIRSALQRFVHAYRPAARMVALVEQVGTIRPDVKEMRLALRDSFVQRTIRGIKRWQAEGLADPTIDVELTAEVLGSMVDHTCYVWMSLGRDFDEEALLDTLTLTWARAIGVDNRTPLAPTAHRGPAGARTDETDVPADSPGGLPPSIAGPTL